MDPVSDPRVPLSAHSDKDFCVIPAVWNSGCELSTTFSTLREYEADGSKNQRWILGKWIVKIGAEENSFWALLPQK
jgi:hypothetical protein